MKINTIRGVPWKPLPRPTTIPPRRSAARLGVDLTEPSEWTCCGSSPALKMDRLLSVSLAAHNLALLDDMGQDGCPHPLPVLLPATC